jgi:DNA polymerase I
VHLAPDIDVEYCETEEELLRKVFDVLCDYPFILTFNGDDFDLRYLAHRAANLGFTKRDVPIEIGKRTCSLRYGIHIDLYKFFFNRSIQIYAYGGRYKDVSLGDVGNALLGVEKIHLEKSFGNLNYSELAAYCLRDSEITYKLTSFEDDSAMKLILVLARISSMPMEDVSRQGVSRWIRNFMHREHRKRGMLIPNGEDILTKKGKTTSTAVIKGKKYKGAIVVEPTPGVGCNGLSQPVPIHHQGLEPWLPIHLLRASKLQKPHDTRHSTLGVHRETGAGKPANWFASGSACALVQEPRKRQESAAGTAQLVQHHPGRA